MDYTTHDLRHHYVKSWTAQRIHHCLFFFSSSSFSFFCWNCSIASDPVLRFMLALWPSKNTCPSLC
jgi:hypothetical protein